MQVISASGLKLTLEITGTQEEPIIAVEPFTAGGKTIGGKANLQHWRSKGLEEGLYFPRPHDAYVQAGKAMTEIRAAIAALPHKIYMARKTTETIDLDGDMCPVTKWHFDMPGCLIKSPKTGDIIGSDRLARFLNSQEISEIEITEAARLWSDANESEEQLARKAAKTARFDAIQQQWADEEEMENGRPLTAPSDPTRTHPREG